MPLGQLFCRWLGHYFALVGKIDTPSLIRECSCTLYPNVDIFCPNNGQCFSVGDATASPCRTLMLACKTFETNMKTVFLHFFQLKIPAEKTNLLQEICTIQSNCESLVFTKLIASSFLWWPKGTLFWSNCVPWDFSNDSW